MSRRIGAGVAISPTQRSLKYLREAGYHVEVVEKTIPRTFIKKDLFGFADLLAIRDDEILLVQVTSGSNVSARVRKIADSEHIDKVRKAGFTVCVHGWRRNAAKKYVLRVVDLS